MNPVFPNTLAISKAHEAPAISRPEVESEVVTRVETSTQEGSYVYVHCYFQNKWENMLIRIWKTTFLIDRISGTRSELVHAENISIAPNWTRIPNDQEYSFLLIFSGLPKDCKQFDLVEEITEPGGFFVGSISRNETDVYHINISG